MAASTTLTTVSELKTYLAITTNEHDDLLTMLVDAASEAAESHCRRRFALAEGTDYYDGSGVAYLLLKRRPVSAVSDLRVDLGRDFGDAALIAPENYTVYGEEGIIYLLSGVFGRGRRNVRVAYTAGYDSVPGDVAQACRMLAAAWFNAGIHGGDGLRAENLGEYTARYAHQPLPEEVRQLLHRYRNWDV